MPEPDPVQASLGQPIGPVIELRLPSVVGWERVAMDAAAAAARLVGLAPDRVDDVRTAVSEATLNAMEHGNAFDARRTVLVALVPRADGLEIHILDVGDEVLCLPASNEPPILREQLNGTAKPRGWGLFLIRSLMDEVDIVPGRHGTQVRMLALRQV